MDDNRQAEACARWGLSRTKSISSIGANGYSKGICPSRIASAGSRCVPVC
jgi:hypothetical protein